LTGTEETVNALSRESFLEFHRHYYSGSNTVATVAGRVTHEQAVAALAPVLSLLPHGAPPEFDASPVPPGRACMKVIEQDTEQVHLSLGFHAWGRLDERRFALKLLSVILGENMSSRLFQKLRERHGFCYSISSGIVTLADTGAIHISAGLDPAKVDRALKVTMQELELLASKPVTLKELRMAQDYTAGQALMGLESTSSQIMWMGECLLGYERVLCPNEVERRFTEVTPEQIQSVAAQALNEGGLGVAIIGPDEKRLTKAFAPLLR
jgi:predicted Zn-dependent peptidase